MTSTDAAWLSILLPMLLTLAVVDSAETYSAAGNLSLSARVRYWSSRWPWLKAVYFAGALLLAWHWWGTP